MHMFQPKFDGSPKEASNSYDSSRKERKMSQEEITTNLRNKNVGDSVDLVECRNVTDSSSGKTEMSCRDFKGTIEQICKRSTNSKDQIIYCMDKAGNKWAGAAEGLVVKITEKDGGQPADGEATFFRGHLEYLV